jgi:uncharacterized protein
VNSFIELVIIGFFVGALVGMTGVGGASIMTPLLVTVMQVNPLLAVGSDLLMSVPTKIYAAYLHRQQRTINPEIVKALSLGGIPGALLGLALLWYFRQHVGPHIVELWMRHAIGAAVLIASVLIVASPILRQNVSNAKAFEWQPSVRARVICVGAFVGFVVSITSIGSGSVTLPLLAVLLPMVGLPQLIGSDIAFAAFLIPVAAAGHWSLGDVNLPLTLTLLIGALPGVHVGSRLCAALNQNWLRPTVAAVLLFAGIRLILA